MKRTFLALLLSSICLISLPKTVSLDGTYSYFDERDRQVFVSDPRYIPQTCYYRIDGLTDYKSALKSLSARELYREKVGDITLIYAYSPNEQRRVTTTSGTFNVMIALSGDSVTLGVPVIKGSY